MSEQQPNTKKKKWNNRSFYIALSICMVAVGAAAWTTYDSITTNINHNQNATSQAASGTTSSGKPVGQTVSGILVSSTSPQTDTSSKKEAASSAPASSQKSGSLKAEEKIPGKTSSIASSKPSSEAAAEPTKFTYPLTKEVSRTYSGENLVYFSTMGDWRAHQGTDFSAKAGDSVKAVADGTVKKIYDDILLGHVVVVAHGSIETSYCGLDGEDTQVKVNDAVSAGQALGTVGTVPMEMEGGAHLHLEMQKEGKWLDPMSVLAAS